MLEGQTANIVILFSGTVSQNFDLRWTVTGTGAAADFVSTTQTTTILAGATSAMLNIGTNDNFTYDGSRTYLLTLESVDGSVVSPATNDFTLTDDELPGAPTLAINDVTVAEGNGAGNTIYTFTVTPSFLPTATVVVNYGTADGTATVGDSDFVAASGTLTLIAGTPSATFNVDVPRDAKFEVNETFDVVLSGGSGYSALGSTLTGTGTINNDDTAPTISIDNPSVIEGSGAGTTFLTYTVTLSALSGVNTIINYATSNGSATSADSDYTTLNSSITIPAGSLTSQISVPVGRDLKFESDETVTVTLSGGSGYTVAGSVLVGTGTITNDDTAPTISIDNPSIAEGTGGGVTTLTYTVSLSAVSGLSTVVNFASSDGTATTADSDYSSASSTLTIPAGSTTGPISVTVTRDAKYEANETINMTLSGGSNYTAAGSVLSGVGTITNDDSAPTISIANISSAEGTGGTTTTQTFTVTASAASGVAITVDYATSNGTATIADLDYASSSGTVTIPAGSLTGTLAVNVNHDAKSEANETYTVTLSNGAGYTAAGSTLSATGTITNDDTAPTVAWTVASQSVTEAGTTMTVTAQLSAVSGQNVSIPFTVSGTATGGGSDYSITASPISINAGATTTTATITVVTDTTPESNETVILTIGTPTNATASGTTVHTATINDDDINAFTITGVQSATLDTISDAYLNYETSPKFIWAAATGAATYDVTVYQNDGTTVACAVQNTASTTFSPASCSLTPGTNYRVKVTAKNANNFTRDATNSLFSFYLNRAPVISATRGVWYFSSNTARTINIVADDPATGANDPATDADGDTITVSAVGTASFGTPAISAPQSMTYTPSAEQDHTDTILVTISDGKGGSATTTVSVQIVSVHRWTGLGADANWNNNMNWCGTIDTSTGACNATGGAPPGTTNNAWFNSSCTQCNATINVPISVGGIWTDASYTGTITQNLGSNVVINGLGVGMYGGSFIGSSDSNTHFTVGNSDFKIKATVTNFTAPRGNLSFAQTTATVRAVEILGPFNHNSGTIRLDGSYSNSSTGSIELLTFDVNPAITVNNFIVNLRNTHTSQPSPSSTYASLVSGDVINVLGDISIHSGGTANGNFYLYGNLYGYCTAVTSCARLTSSYHSSNIHFSGPNDATFTTDQSYGQVVYPRITIAKDTNFVRVYSADNKDVRFASLELVSGEFEAPTGTLSLGKPWSSNADADKSYGLNNTGGIFTHNDGTVLIDVLIGNGANSFSNYFLINTPTATNLYNLILDARKSSSGAGRPEIAVASATILNVENTIVHNSGQLGGSGSITLLGPSYTANCPDPILQCAWKQGFNSSSAASVPYLVFAGSAPQTYSFAANAWAPRIRIQKNAIGETVSPAPGSDLNVFQINLNQGTLNLPATTRIGVEMFSTTTGLTAGFNLVAGAGNGVINHNNGTVEHTVNGFAQTFTGSLGQYVTNGRTLNLYNLTLDIYGTAAANIGSLHIPNNDLVSIQNNLLIKSGSFNSTGGTPSTKRVEVWGNLSFTCTSVGQCASYHVNATSVELRGLTKTIQQDAGAQFPFRYMNLNLTNNSQNLVLLSDLNANTLNGLGVPWTDLTLTSGNINLGVNFFTGINNLNIAAGPLCSAPLTYVMATGAVGSGCGP